MSANRAPKRPQRAEELPFDPGDERQLSMFPNDVPSATAGGETVSPPWAGGIDLRTARGGRWVRLLHPAAGDPERLREIQIARGYRSGWTHRAAQEAARPDVGSSSTGDALIWFEVLGEDRL